MKEFNKRYINLILDGEYKDEVTLLQDILLDFSANAGKYDIRDVWEYMQQLNEQQINE